MYVYVAMLTYYGMYPNKDLLDVLTGCKDKMPVVLRMLRQDNIALPVVVQLLIYYIMIM